MKALVLQKIGEPPLMEVEEREKPIAKPGYSLIRVHAATVNPLSHQIRTGIFGGVSLPLVLSNDGSGTVEESEVFAAGTRVIVYGGAQLGIKQDGLQQQWACISNDHLIPLPETLSLDEGAALPINYVTAYQAMQRVAEVAQGQHVLISGGSGSVGQALIQTARALGAIPIAIVSNSAKVDRALEAGAEHVIDLAKDDLRQRVAEITEGEGANFAFDTVGGALTGRLLSAVRTRGAVVCIGFVGGTSSTVDVADIVIYEKQLRGYDAHLETASDVASAMEYILKYVAQGRLRPQIDSVYPLERFEDAYTRLNSRIATGAILVQP